VVSFDAGLPGIEANSGRLMPNAVWRDWLFTGLRLAERENGTLKPILGKFHWPYVTAFNALRDDLAEQGYPMGIIYFDADHKLEGTHDLEGAHDVFDYTGRISTLKNISRATRRQVR
jgi:hypothetical protein